MLVKILLYLCPLGLWVMFKSKAYNQLLSCQRDQNSITDSPSSVIDVHNVAYRSSNGEVVKMTK